MFQPASPNGPFDLRVKQDQWENITIVYSVIKFWSAAWFKNSTNRQPREEEAAAQTDGGARGWCSHVGPKTGVTSVTCSSSPPSNLASKTASLAHRPTVTDGDKNQGRQTLKAQTDCVKPPPPCQLNLTPVWALIAANSLQPRPNTCITCTLLPAETELTHCLLPRNKIGRKRSANSVRGHLQVRQCAMSLLAKNKDQTLSAAQRINHTHREWRRRKKKIELV